MEGTRKGATPLPTRRLFDALEDETRREEVRRAGLGLETGLEGWEGRGRTEWRLCEGRAPGLRSRQVSTYQTRREVERDRGGSSSPNPQLPHSDGGGLEGGRGRRSGAVYVPSGLTLPKRRRTAGLRDGL